MSANKVNIISLRTRSQEFEVSQGYDVVILTN